MNPPAVQVPRTSGEPAQSARLRLSPRVSIWRLWVDRWGRHLVTGGGIVVIVSVLAILVVIAWQAAPLLKRPAAALVSNGPSGAKPEALAVGTDEYQETGYVVDEEGLTFFDLQAPSAGTRIALPELGAVRISAVAALPGGLLALGLRDGRVLLVKVKFETAFVDGKRRSTHKVEPGALLTLGAKGGAIRKLAVAQTDSVLLLAAATGPRTVELLAVTEATGGLGPPKREETRQTVELVLEGEISALCLDESAENLFVGSTSGQVLCVDVEEPESPRPDLAVTACADPGGGITVLGLLSGDRTLVAGDTVGRVSSWQNVRGAGRVRNLVRMHDFLPHADAVNAFGASSRDRCFVTVDQAGVARIHYGTTGQTLLTIAIPNGGATAVSFSPRADGLLAVTRDGQVSHWRVDLGHPAISLRTLFAPVWYESYSQPGYTWQTTGSADSEPKYSLTPLIYGTLKGTFYALVFAIPVALLGALYTSQFMHPSLKALVKPTVEVMAALPSVVLGFVGGLWLAPVLAKAATGVFGMPLFVLAFILVTLLVWRTLPLRLRAKVRPGMEIVLLVPLVLVAAWAALRFGGWLEKAFLGGNFTAWLRDQLNVTYDQRNSLVVGFAMGFAVIPIIFTIAEDALSSVPPHLVAGSLAVGATRWQTAIRVVLPTASPGIFSAVMIGFGRAVGETMIVLMATGNTAIMDASPFNGFRALSANIAVELPEASEGGTLYRLLFLTALLLFAMTFAVNTAAELVRLKLRMRYRSL